MSDQTTIAEAKTAARAAALWWAEQIGAPVFKMMRGDEPRREREMGDVAGMLGFLAASNHPVSEEAGAKFADALEKHISDQLERGHWVSLGVDYGPDYELGEIARAAGISTSRFPWKTDVHVTREYVTASLGYGAPSRLIWSAPDWDRPACGTQRYERDGRCFDEICPKPRFHDDDHGDWIPDPRRCRECGGTYTAHFGGSAYLGHSWRPVEPGEVTQ